MAASGGPWCPRPVAVAHVCLASPCRPLCVSPVRTPVPGFGAHPDLGSRQNDVTKALFPDEVHVPDGHLSSGLLPPGFFPAQLLPSDRGMQARLPAPRNRPGPACPEAGWARLGPPGVHASPTSAALAGLGRETKLGTQRKRKDQGSLPFLQRHGAWSPWTIGTRGLGRCSQAPKTMLEGIGIGSGPHSGLPRWPADQHELHVSEQHPCFSRFWVRCLKSIHVWAGSLWRLRGRIPQAPGSGLCPAPGLCSPHPTLCFCCFVPFPDRPSHRPLGRTLVGTRPAPRRPGQSPPKSLHQTKSLQSPFRLLMWCLHRSRRAGPTVLGAVLPTTPE